jgi:hypothetical protein
VGRGEVVRRFLRLAFVFALVACGGNGDSETSLHLVVNNGPNVPVPVEVEVDFFEGTSQMVRDNITRAVPAGAATLLGDVVVYPAPGTSLLRFVVVGRKEGVTISSAVVSAAVKVGQQVEVVATLKAGANVVPAPDGGVGSPDAAPIPGKKTTGQACAQGSECGSGSCLDSVCCDKACDGVCNTCKAQGQAVGMCVALVDGTKCGEPTCSSNKRTLSQHSCKTGACVQQDQSCSNRQCSVTPPMCR